MIVQCVNCETRFQLDEARVPLAGVRVRCSRCKESFFLAHPSASEAEAINEVVEQAVYQDRPPAPDAARDLDSGDELSFASAVPTPEHETLPHQAPESPSTADPVLAGLGDDDDWQFSDEIPEQEPFADAELLPGIDSASPVALEDRGADEPFSDAAPPGLAAPGFLDPAPSGEGFSQDQFDGDQTDEMPFLDDRVVEAPSLEEPVAESPLIDTGSSPPVTADDGGAVFGSVEDFSSLIEEVTTGAEPAGQGVASSHHATGASAFGDPSDMSIDSPAPRTSEAAAVEQLGDPEDWNFFSETPAAEYQRPVTASMPSLESRAAAAGLEDLAADEDALRDPAVAGAGWEARHAIARVGHGLGWFATLSLVVAALAQGFFLGEVRARASLGPLTVGGAVVDRLVPSWIDNQYEPRMLAVRGRLSNPTGQALAHGQTLLVALLDGAGNPLTAPPALAAISLSEESIRELPMDQLRMAQARGAGALARSTLAPGEEIGFTALFDAVPPGAVSLQLQTGPVWEVPDARVTTPAPDASPMPDGAPIAAEMTDAENGLLR